LLAPALAPAVKGVAIAVLLAIALQCGRARQQPLPGGCHRGRSWPSALVFACLAYAAVALARRPPRSPASSLAAS
jgi:hypothetical protein